MRAFELGPGFGLDQLGLRERPSPTIRPGAVRVRVTAASLNYRDLLMVRGAYNPKQRLPLIPVSDGVGQVVELGDGVEGLRVGDRVAGLFSQTWDAGDPTPRDLRATLGGPLDGMLAEEAVLPASGVVRVPAYLSDVEAATLPCAALTAFSALVTHGHLAPGEVVLVQGTGGVALFAVAFAKLAGARVLVTSGSHEKLARARALGADETIHYGETPAWGTRARELTDGRGVDHVIELGGAGTLAESLRAVRPGGTVSLIGILTGKDAAVPLTSILMQQVRVQGILVGHRRSFEAMTRALEASTLRPVIDRVFPFAEARAAFEHLAAARHVGKICLALP